MRIFEFILKERSFCSAVLGNYGVSRPLRINKQIQGHVIGKVKRGQGVESSQVN